MLGNTPNAYMGLAIDRVERAVAAAGLHFDPVKINSANALGRGLDKVRRANLNAVLVAAAPAFSPIARPSSRSWLRISCRRFIAFRNSRRPED